MDKPVVLSVQSGETVRERVILVYGRCGPERGEGAVIVEHDHGFPSQEFPCTDSHFKALVHLERGRNHVSFVNRATGLRTDIELVSEPNLSAPPLHLAILLSRDSPETFDAPPNLRSTATLDTAVRKLRMAAYLWQAFTGEQMLRAGMGRRAFRLDEQQQPASAAISCRQRSSANTARVHVVRSSHSLAEFRDPDVAQQNPKGRRRGDLYSFAADALRAYGGPFKREHSSSPAPCVAVCILDAHYDTSARIILAHAALGGGTGDLNFGIFGSHNLFTFPTCLEDVVPTFLNDTPTPASLANDNGEAGSYWENANIGLGAFLHEVGHAMSCPHEPDGVMLRAYTRFNRTFMCREPFSTRTRRQAHQPLLQRDECGWHRLDIVRFRFHPMFALSGEEGSTTDAGTALLPLADDAVLVRCATGLALVEVFADGHDLCDGAFELRKAQQAVITEREARERAGAGSSAPLRINVVSAALSNDSVRNLRDELRASAVHGGSLRRSLPVGQRGQQGRPFEAVLVHRPVARIRVRAGAGVDCIVFEYADGSSARCGSGNGGNEHTFDLKHAQGEMLAGLFVRAGFWVDAVQFVTTWGRRSGLYGNSQGGRSYDLFPPDGCFLTGVNGTAGGIMDSISIVYAWA